MTTSPNAITEPSNDEHHTTRSPTTTTHTNKNHHAPEDPPTDIDQDPKLQHTQASGSPGDRREPWRAAAKIDYKINCSAAVDTVAVTDSHEIGLVASC